MSEENSTPTSRRSRRSASSQSGEQQSEQSEAAPSISVSIGQLSGSTKQVNIRPGTTVRRALEEAGIERGKNSVIIRGARVNLDYVLEDHDTIVVTQNVRGGVR